MRRGLLAIALLGALTFWMLVVGPASSEVAPTPAPAPASAAPAPSPAAPALVGWALRQRAAALRARRPLARADACMGHRQPRAVARAPRRSCDALTWKTCGDSWRAQARSFKRTLALRLRQMRHPGGPASGVQWWPAALYCGWSPRLKSWFSYIVMRESTGRPDACNPSSNCYGLLQEHPCWWLTQHGWAWIRDPLNQLRLGWHIYQVQGASAWAL